MKAILAVNFVAAAQCGDMGDFNNAAAEANRSLRV
jgi:hypothetical protein